ncbi:ribosome small subunit-dependent GTPase A [Bacillus kexueae]|uniref:ribosome small subunit-dependent GTPase A n=1 Tax=Aeribacillus kexueae TaxID=2078952 RepID=UPI001FAE8301|nr:ribosome small subunit-dependent GTPase A [Bacillus kexueae]
MKTLETFGWNDFFQAQVEDWDGAIGRVTLEHKHMYRIANESGEWLGELSGKFRFDAVCKEDYPAVGDWVLFKPLPNEKKAVIQHVLNRKSRFIRQSAGSKIEQQIVAANVDYVFIVSSLNRDFNVRRIERYVLLAYDSGATPVIVLTKKDLCEDIEEKRAEVEEVAIGVPVVCVNNIEREGYDELSPYLLEGKTIALLGSSGVGKSSLLNGLMNQDVQKTLSVRDGDDKGRHTTTHRELFSLPNGALIIDTPGMRELKLWEGEESLDSTFADIEELARTCRFNDCQHESEPDCAVKKAIDDGSLAVERLKSYKKLQREIAFSMRKQDEQLALIEKQKWKKIHKHIRKMPRKR